MEAAALRRARELRGLSANSLANRLNVSQAIIWKIEAGQVRASADLTLRIAEELSVPPEFLLRSPRFVSEGSVGLMRAYSSKITKADTASIRQHASILFEFVDRLAEGEARPQASIPRAFGEAPILAAERARSLLGYSEEEPVGNLTRRLERLGVTVVKSGLKADAVFGFSTWANEKVPRPFIVLSHHQTPYRMRWTLAHELGHVILGHEYAGVPAGEAESEADEFAGALLVPPGELAKDLLAGTTLSALSYLKAKYGVSIKALASLGHKIGMIDIQKYTSLNVQISQKGWRRSEPGDELAEYEEPRLIQELLGRKHPGATTADVSHRMGMPCDVISPAVMTTREFQVSEMVRRALEGEPHEILQGGLGSTLREGSDYA